MSNPLLITLCVYISTDFKLFIENIGSTTDLLPLHTTLKLI